MKKIKYTWQEFDKDVILLIRRIKYSKFQPETLVCLATGGCPLGTKLHNRLEKPLTIISVKSYEDTKQGAILLNSSYTVPLRSPVLLLDDVADSGKTIQLVKSHLELGGVEVRTATLFYKEHSVIKPDWYIHKISEEWLIFPWE